MTLSQMLSNLVDRPFSLCKDAQSPSRSCSAQDPFQGTGAGSDRFADRNEDELLD